MPPVPRRLAIAGNWLVVTNKDELGKAVLDRYLDADSNAGTDRAASLSDNDRFQQARKTQPADAVAWAYADVPALRMKGAGEKVYEGLKGNPVAELLLGGAMAMAGEAPFATAALAADRQRLAISTAIPFDPDSIDKAREYYFGPAGEGAAPPPATAQETIFSLSTIAT